MVFTSSALLSRQKEIQPLLFFLSLSASLQKEPALRRVHKYNYKELKVANGRSHFRFRSVIVSEKSSFSISWITVTARAANKK